MDAVPFCPFRIKGIKIEEENVKYITSYFRPPSRDGRLARR